MRRIAMFVLGLAAVGYLQAQGGPPTQRPRSSTQTRSYDATQEVSLKGTVLEIRTVPMGRGSGVHLRVKSEGKELDLHLGPSRFLTDRKWEFAKGDELAFVGAKGGTGDPEFVIAREVTRKGETLVLRDKAGVPAWSRGSKKP